MKALIIGGTGPSGPFLVDGLRQRGYTVTIFHRGTHEIPEIPPDVEHIHGDPHFRETIDSALAGRNFDVVIATYGRIRLLAEALAGRTPCFIAIGGVPVYRGYFEPSANFPHGMKTPVPEDATLVASEAEQPFCYKIVSTEAAVLAAHPRGVVFRYPYVYGPYQLLPREWCVIRRVLDRRSYIFVPDGGLSLLTHGYAENLAHAVMLAVDKPDVAAGQIYNCGDEYQLTIYQLVEVIAHAMNHKWEIIGLPDAFGTSARALVLAGTTDHCVVDLSKLKTELGYHDPVPVEEAIARTVAWYVEHQPEHGGDLEQRLRDQFDYAAEDRVLKIYREAVARASAISFGDVSRPVHPYPHPNVPGQQRDHRNR
jgi:nucleoside-diphosphate-sugar epimerase